jgi:hypothetical protein
MKKYLFLNETTKKATIKSVEESFFDNDWRSVLFPGQTDDFIFAKKLTENGYFDFWIDGVLCLEGDLSYDGISFYLIIPSGTEKETIKKVKSEIKYVRDVTVFHQYIVNLKIED